jgi:hypothetical protein
MTQYNPFPDYPVVRLKDDAESVGAKTIDTDAIATSHKLLEPYIDQWRKKHTDSHVNVEPLIVRVEGDYGTGKTHLLLDAIALVQKDLDDLYPDINIMRVTCSETDPVQWYRSTIGGELARPFLINMVVRLYAEAGKDVAAGAELTKAAVQQLESDYQSIYKLIQASALNISKVDDRFNELITEICKEAGEDLRKVLAGLVWDGTVKLSTRWLAGSQLMQDELNKLRISASLTTETDVINVLTAVAAIHKYLSCPFGLFIDEVEHWARFDLARTSEGNMVWLKELLQNLAAYKSLVFICGRLEAWRSQGDVVERFTSYKSIRLERLKPEKVESIVRTILTAANLTSFIFGEEQAKAVTECTGGIIRRVLSFCRFLFRETDGFSQPLSGEHIRELAEEAGQRISRDEAKLIVHEFLEKEELRVISDDSVGNLQFDLVGYHGNQPRVIVEFMHARTQQHHLDYALRFVERMKEVYSHAPEVFGCFIADGNVEESVQSQKTRDLPFKIFWFDLTERDVLNKIARTLGEYLRGAQSSDGEVARFKGLLNESERVEAQLSEARRSENQELIKQLQLQREAIELQVEQLRSQVREKNTDLEKYLGTLEAQRSTELRALYEQLEKLSERMNTKQEVNVLTTQKDELDVRLHATYTELTRSLPLSNKIRLAFPGQTIGIVGINLVFALSLIFISSYFLEAFFFSDSKAFSFARLVLILMGVIILIVTLLQIWRRLTDLDKYTEFSARVLREIYLRSTSPEDLVRADGILRDILEEKGPRAGKNIAREVLGDVFPKILSHLSYTTHGRKKEEEVSL